MFGLGLVSGSRGDDGPREPSYKVHVQNPPPDDISFVRPMFYCCILAFASLSSPLHPLSPFVSSVPVRLQGQYFFHTDAWDQISSEVRLGKWCPHFWTCCLVHWGPVGVVQLRTSAKRKNKGCTLSVCVACTLGWRGMS